MVALPAHTTVAEVDALWREAYDGEISGETFFSSMAGGVADRDRRSKLEILARLEAATRIEMIPAMETRGLSIEIDSGIADAGVAFGVAAAGGEWKAAMAAIDTVTERYLGIYRAMVESAQGDEEARTAQLLVDHEVALQTFARRELDEHPNSIELVEALPHLR